jgi:6,7-dimethyl-8-ribityllumazine synthase
MRQKQILIVKEAAPVSEALIAGALSVLDSHDIASKVVEVPNISQIPAVVRFAVRTMELRTGEDKFSGYVLLGASPAVQEPFAAVAMRTLFHGIQKLKMDYCLAIGQGVMFPEDTDAGKVGAEAAEECLRMLDIKRELGL